jgi:TPR repeat protein
MMKKISYYKLVIKFFRSKRFINMALSYKAFLLLMLMGSGAAEAALSEAEFSHHCLTRGEVTFFRFANRHFVSDPLERLPLDFLIGCSPTLRCPEAKLEEDQCNTQPELVRGESHWFELELPDAMEKIRQTLIYYSNQGNNLATLFLGHIYMHGIGFPQDLSAAYQYILAAVERRYVPAKFQMALFLFKYALEDVDLLSQAHSLMQESFDKKYFYSQLFYVRNVLLGKDAAHLGEMPAQDEKEKAFNFVDFAVNQTGNSDALFLRGLCYHNGVGTPKNETKAEDDLRVAMQKNNDDATFFYAQLLYEGSGGERNIDLALQIFHTITHPGNSKAVRVAALNKLAFHCMSMHDWGAASQWVNKAVALGDYTSGLVYVGEIYRHYPDRLRFQDNALTVLKSAVAANHPRALTLLEKLHQMNMSAGIL